MDEMQNNASKLFCKSTDFQLLARIENWHEYQRFNIAPRLIDPVQTAARQEPANIVTCRAKPQCEGQAQTGPVSACRLCKVESFYTKSPSISSVWKLIFYKITFDIKFQALPTHVGSFEKFNIS